MNFEEKKNLTYRIIASLFLAVSLGTTIFSLAQIIILRPEEVVLMLIAVAVASLFAILEIFVILRGGKKESYLYKIAFNENKHINNVPLIAVGVGTAFGLGLLALAISVYLIRDTAIIKSSMLVVLSISVYLLVNCVIYYIYLYMFKNRPINLRDFIK